MEPTQRSKHVLERLRKEEIDLSAFIREAWHVVESGRPYVHGKHIDAIAEHLTAVTNGEIKRLLVNMPPRHGKSTIITVIWRMWSWLQHPEHRWLCASYALSLAIRDNLKCRRIIESNWFQEHYGYRFQLAPDQNQKMRFENTKGGYSLVTSVGASATGEGGDCLLIDDPHSIDEKTSDTMRLAALGWFQDTWYTRRNDPIQSSMVVVGQRIHDKDVSGYILSGDTGEEWTHLNLAAEYEHGYHCKTFFMDGSLRWQDWRSAPGELLWPSRFPKTMLEQAKQRHGALGYAALYQQQPVPSTGGLFKESWFRYFEETEEAYILHCSSGDKSFLKSDCWKFGTGDLAISSKQTADYTVFCVWAVTPDMRLLLLHVFRDRIDNATQLRTLKSLHVQYDPDFWKIESVAYQLAFLQQAISEGLPCREYRPVKDKVSRASTASVFQENERVFHLKGASWGTDCRSEMLVFPLGAHDDFVDNNSMATEEIALSGLPSWAEESESTLQQEEESHGSSVAFQKTPQAQIDPFAWAARFDDGGEW